MEFVRWVDPLLLYLVIIPFFTIGLGVITVFFTRKISFGPLVTFAVLLVIELLFHIIYYPNSSIHLSSWLIILPCVSLFFSWLVITAFEYEEKYKAL
ncbi:hypothetical protein ACERII_24440 [Evansella sp. AB-rgal1]|uniref:hypothetical protein n=1 Tax=Evansella sp. AB-rgal1 TaxID=3242696 RepID=UPI00359E0BFA